MYSCFCIYTVTGEPQDLGGMNGFFEEAVSLVPQDEVISLFFDKLEKSNDFSLFFERVGSEDFDNLMEKLKVSFEKKNKQIYLLQ